MRPIDETDLVKVLNKLALRAGISNFISAIAGAAPPVPIAKAYDRKPGTASAMRVLPEARTIESLSHAQQLLARAELPDFSVERFGSNAVALGRDLTGGAGALLGNPHFPWFGIERFYALHLTVPGRYDVMGPSVYGFPLVSIGFSKRIAWSHTVSTARWDRRAT